MSCGALGRSCDVREALQKRWLPHPSRFSKGGRQEFFNLIKTSPWEARGSVNVSSARQQKLNRPHLGFLLDNLRPPKRLVRGSRHEFDVRQRLSDEGGDVRSRSRTSNNNPRTPRRASVHETQSDLRVLDGL